MADKDYSLSALTQFLDTAAKKGLIKQNTASSRKQAATKILGTLPETETADLRNVDLEDAFWRFTNLHEEDYTPQSMRVYLSRAKSALKDFFAYREDPSKFKPTGASRASPSPQRKSQGGGKSASSKSTGAPPPPAEDGNRKNQVTIPIPLRADLTVEVWNLPSDLTQAEAARIAAIVTAYAAPAEAEKT